MLAKKLKYGDTIGIVGVSNSIKENNIPEEKIFEAKKFFENKGFKIKLSSNVFEDYHGSAGPRETRARELMKMFKDQEVKAIICLTGGETSNTILDILDYDIIKNNPKIFIGYSDITVLLNTIYDKTGLITFSGPCFLEYTTEEREKYYYYFEKTYVEAKFISTTTLPNKIIRKGETKGILLGTNLACMMYQIGTPYFPNMKDKILAIESLNTSPNECQRRFAWLKYAGVFDDIKGIIIGYNYDFQKDGDYYPQMEDFLLEYTKEYNFPIVKCNDFGHNIIMSNLPIGVTYAINNEEITLLDPFLKD